MSNGFLCHKEESGNIQKYLIYNRNTYNNISSKDKDNTKLVAVLLQCINISIDKYDTTCFCNWQRPWNELYLNLCILISFGSSDSFILLSTKIIQLSYSIIYVVNLFLFGIITYEYIKCIIESSNTSLRCLININIINKTCISKLRIKMRQ